jgi:hypothetical protein
MNAYKLYNMEKSEKKAKESEKDKEARAQKAAEEFCDDEVTEKSP